MLPKDEEHRMSTQASPIAKGIEDGPIADMILELAREESADRALRKALLFLISIVQADASSDLSAYISYLLTKFPPLSAHFQDNLHPFTRDEDALRKVIVDDKVGVLRVWRGSGFGGN